MKATGIVRKVDELGRITIPRELRRVMGIGDGDPLEIFTDNDGGIVIKPYTTSGQWTEQLARLGNEIIQDTSIKMETRAMIVERLNAVLDTFEDKKSPSSAATE